jgi:hypothetical protein
MLRRYVPIVVISALLAVSGFAAAAIASSEGLAAAAQTATATVVTTVVQPTTVTQTETVTRQFPLVTICHHGATSRGGPAGRHVTMRVRSNLVAAHRSHGDSRGSCATRANRRLHRSAAHVRKYH